MKQFGFSIKKAQQPITIGKKMLIFKLQNNII